MFNNRKSGSIWTGKLVTIVLLFLSLLQFSPVSAQSEDETPPLSPVKLIFIHHSCGENWLSDEDGGLGLALAENNYFVSDTNYGWGPDSIGDRTDITDWPEWFTGPDSDRNTAALYNESEQNAYYSRSFADPGGENQIIMFKSCFPNSNLEGNPGDPPRRGVGLTVGNAKAIYNELLAYFATQPDKLFIAVTAPPVQDPTFSANARAFNTWLVTEWLQDYEGSNVAVFDYYNGLTGPDNHHHFRNGQIEYITDQEGDTLHYDSDGDDHPSSAGNQKATAEFLPLLNIYTNRWLENGPPPLVEQAVPTEIPAEEESEPLAEPTAEPVSPAPQTAAAGSLIDNFEGSDYGWEAIGDDTGESSIECRRDDSEPFSGSAALHITYDIAPGGWANCNLIHESAQDWGETSGFMVHLRANQAGQPLIFTVFQGESSDEFALFEYRLATNQEAVDGWQRVDVTWEQLAEPQWQGDGTAVFDPAQAIGLAFSFEGPEDGRSAGDMRVDEIYFLGETAIETQESSMPEPAVTSIPQEETAEESDNRGFLPCSGALIMSLPLFTALVWVRREKDL